MKIFLPSVPLGDRPAFGLTEGHGKRSGHGKRYPYSWGRQNTRRIPGPVGALACFTIVARRSAKLYSKNKSGLLSPHFSLKFASSFAKIQRRVGGP